MYAVEISSVSKQFKEGGKKFYALKGVSFGVKNKEIFGILGPNGSGKTTLLNIIMNVLIPDAGYVKILGKDPNKERGVLEQMNFVSGDARFHWALTVENILNFYGMIYNLGKDERGARIEKLVKVFGAGDLLKRRFFTLSTGERMRVILVRSLINKPKIILMDEPTLGLDPDISITVRNEIRKASRKFKTTILLTSHYMYEVEQLCDRIAFINKGLIVDVGSVEKVKLKKFTTYDAIITLARLKDRAFLIRQGFKIRGNKIYKSVGIDKNISEVLSVLGKRKYEITNVETRKPTLEDYFVKITKEGQKNESI